MTDHAPHDPSIWLFVTVLFCLSVCSLSILASLILFNLVIP